LRKVNVIVLSLSLLAPAAVWAETSDFEKLIPLKSLTETNRALVKGVTDHYTLRRDYAAQQLTVTKAQLEWMIDNMHATWRLAREFGLQVRCTRTDEQGRMWNDDGDGAKGFIITVYKAPGKRIYYMQGSQKKLWTIHGRGVVVVDYREDKPGTMTVTGAQYVRVDNAILAAITQFCGPLLCNMVDKTYHEFIQPLSKLGATAAADPGKLRDAVGRLPKDEAEALKSFGALLPAQPAATAAATR